MNSYRPSHYHDHNHYQSVSPHYIASIATHYIHFHHIHLLGALVHSRCQVRIEPELLLDSLANLEESEPQHNYQ